MQLRFEIRLDMLDYGGEGEGPRTAPESELQEATQVVSHGATGTSPRCYSRVRNICLASHTLYPIAHVHLRDVTLGLDMSDATRWIWVRAGCSRDSLLRGRVDLVPFGPFEAGARGTPSALSNVPKADSTCSMPCHQLLAVHSRM